MVGPESSPIDLLERIDAEGAATDLVLLDVDFARDGEAGWVRGGHDGHLVRAVPHVGGSLRVSAGSPHGPLELRVSWLSEGGNLGAGDAVPAAWLDALRNSPHLQVAETKTPGKDLKLNVPPPREAGAGNGYVLLSVATQVGTTLAGRVTLSAIPKRSSGLVKGHRPHIPEGSRDKISKHRVALGADFRPSVVIPAGREVRIDVALPGRAPRMEWAVGALAGTHPQQLGPVELAVEVAVGGRIVAEHATMLRPHMLLEDAFWREERLDLAEAAGESATITLRAEGADGHGVAVAHPRVVPASGVRAVPNVLLISLDTLRADRVGAASGAAGLTPHIDALASGGTTFRTASSTAPFTLPAHGSMFSGQFPSVHGGVSTTTALRVELSTPSPVLTRILRAAGWNTAAFTGGGYVSPDYGFSAGFDRFVITDALRNPGADLPDELQRGSAGPLPSELDGAALRKRIEGEALRRARTDTVIDWLGANAERPFFLFVHTYTTHNFSPTDDLYEELCGDRCGSTWGNGAKLRVHRNRLLKDGGGEVDAADHAHIEHVYDATVRQVDAQVGRILGALDDLGIAEDTLVVLASDHGEEFFEHGNFGHSKTLYESLLHVPLVLRGPGVPVGEILVPVSLVDLAPTVLSLVGLPVDARMQGGPLPLPGGAQPGEALVYAEVSNDYAVLDAVRTDRWKLIRDRTPSSEGPEWELFDLQVDGMEQRDLAGDAQDVRAALGARLVDHREILDDLDRFLGTSLGGELSPETRAALVNMGYIDG